MKVRIAPSILSARFECLGDEVKAVEKAGVDQIHVDVMDGHFVPNLSMGPIVVEALRRTTRLPLDVHLMITEPARHLEAFVAAGASHVSFHVEVADEPARMARWLKDRGVGAGLALNPETPVERVLSLLPDFDLLLVMTVRPGFGGQKFLPDNLEKIRRIRAEGERTGSRPLALDVEVDGGIDATTARLCRQAGANVFVAGSSIFKAKDPAQAVCDLRASVAQGDNRPAGSTSSGPRTDTESKHV
jgi:ribulose-phosphate 3-epimerase